MNRSSNPTELPEYTKPDGVVSVAIVIREAILKELNNLIRSKEHGLSLISTEKMAERRT